MILGLIIVVVVVVAAAIPMGGTTVVGGAISAGIGGAVLVAIIGLIGVFVKQYTDFRVQNLKNELQRELSKQRQDFEQDLAR